MDTKKWLDSFSIMKYFTPYWHGDISEEETVQIRDSYWNYIDKISEKLSFTIRIIAKYINLHDAIIQEFSYDKIKKIFFLNVLVGIFKWDIFLWNVTISEYMTTDFIGE